MRRHNGSAVKVRRMSVFLLLYSVKNVYFKVLISAGDEVSG